MDKPVILIIEDNEDFLKLLRMFIADDILCEIEVAKSGTEGMRMLNKLERVDLVITDIDLGDGINGKRIVEMVQQVDRLSFPPPKTLIISGRRNQNEMELLAERIGADGSFAKPFRWKEFQEKIQELLYFKQLVA